MNSQLIHKSGSNSLKILFYLLPFTLVLGPFFADLFVSMIAIIFIYFVFKKKDFTIFKSKAILFLCLFQLYVLILSLISEDPYLSLESSLFFFRFIFFTAAGIYIISIKDNFIKNFKLSLLITILFILFDSYFQFFIGYNLIGYEVNYYPSGMRFAGMFGDEMVLGKFLLSLVPLLTAMLFHRENYKRSNNILICLIILFSLIIIFLSGERTNFILFFFFSVIILLSTSLRRYCLYIISGSILSVLIIMNFNPNVYDRYITTTYSELYSNGKINLLTPGHEQHYKTAFKLFLDKPIFGNGPKMFRKLCAKEEFNSGSLSCSTHPHNYYLQFLSELGLVGTIPIIIIFFLLLYKILNKIFSTYIYRKESEINDYQTSLLVIVFINLWPLAPSMNFFNNWVLILFFLPIPFLLSSNINITNGLRPLYLKQGKEKYKK